jgi:peptidoglycan/LPS O-acetylase OafA/YrhL
LEYNSASILWIVSYVVTVLVVSHFSYRLIEVPGKRYLLQTLVSHAGTSSKESNKPGPA